MSDTVLQDERLIETGDEEGPIQSPLWKNLVFLTTGRTVLGIRTHLSREAAHAVMLECEAEIGFLMGINPNTRVVLRRTGETLFRVREYSHCIQVPWKGDAE